MAEAYINRIATAVPPYDVHDGFVRFARTLFPDHRRRSLFDRLAERAQINHRWSCLPPANDPEGSMVDGGAFYRRGGFPSTAERMIRYEAEAVPLAIKSVEGLGREEAATVTHLIAVTCTGFFAPGLDLEIIRRCGLSPKVERTTVGFMGCQAALNALKLARHIVRSEPSARVLVVSVELCTLHLQETDDLAQVLSFLIFGDGAAAALVTAEPTGLALERFHGAVEPEQRSLITWDIRDHGFTMFLSGQVPGAVGASLRAGATDILSGDPSSAITHWAVHPGGRTILDAVETALELGPQALTPSRHILAEFGNMSSATTLFVLKEIEAKAGPGDRGCAIAFGPGLSTEGLLFRKAA
jgi:predicted naringenin-chalcone synthase